MALHHYLPQDRLRALSENRGLPAQTLGAALFADICGFTGLTEALALQHGERRGVEVLMQTVGRVYDTLITEVERYGGSTQAFAGDAITCWFDAARVDALADAAARAVQAALAMQRVTHGFAPLALKVSVASGPASRFTVGDAAIQTLDVLAGPTVSRVAMADTLARPGDIWLDQATAQAVGAPALEQQQHSTGAAFVLLDPAWRGPPLSAMPSWSEPAELPPAQILRRWVLPFVYERERSGQGLFVTDLRPVVALFLRLPDLNNTPDHSAVQPLDPRISATQQLLQAHGGVLLELTVGDKGSYLYAAFGAAHAHEDDARRALRAALALRSVFDGRACMGLASGTLRVGAYGARTRQSFGAQGDAVNAAARLMTLAQPGEILTSGRVRGAAANEFALQARAPIALKGKAEPMPVFALLGLQRPRTTRLQETDFVLPMVGREQVLQQLAHEVASVAQSQGAVVAVVAEAGMGKSRLLAEAVRLALQGGFVGYGGSAAGDGVRKPYRLWQGVWTAFFDVHPAQSPRLQTQAVERAVQAALARRGSPHAEAWPLLGPVLGLDLPDNAFTQALAPKDRKALLQALLVDALRAAAEDAAQDGAGVLLLLEDLHRADTLSLDLLRAVVQASATAPVLPLLSARPPIAADGTEGGARVLRITLTGLDAAQAEQLIRAKLAAQFPERAGAVPRALIERVVERAQGNPFYIEELLNHLHDRGLDPRQPETLNALDWPASLRSLVLSRIDRLSLPQQLALKVASVIGPTFGLVALHSCHPGVGSLEVLHADLLELVRLGLITPAENATEPQFGFKHRVTLEVAYDSLAHDSRVHLHALLAQHLQAQHTDSLTLIAPALAHHWARAEQPEQAWPHMKRAGEQAAAQYANEEALACFAQVLSWLPATAQAERVDTWLQREAVLDLLARHDERQPALDQLDSLAGPAEAAAPLRAKIALRRANLALDLGDFAAAHNAATRALAGTDPAHDIEALLLLARAVFSAGQAEAARTPLDQALMLARQHGLAVGESRVLAQLGLVDWHAGRYDKAQALLLSALPALQEHNELRHALNVLNNLGVVAKSHARYAPAVAYYEQAQAIARRIGDRSGEAMLFNNMGSACLAAGDFYGAVQHTDSAARIWSALHEPSQHGAALLNRAEAHRELGQYGTAQTLAEQALALLRTSGLRRGEATVLENLGRIALALAQHDAAMQWLQAALAIAREIGWRAIEASTLYDIGRVHLATGRHAEAASALAIAQQQMRALGDEAGLLEVQAAQAELALAQGGAHAPQQALAHIAALLPRLTPQQGAAALPMGLYTTAWRVLVAAGDGRAPPVREQARAELRERSARIADPAARRDYLNVAEHRLLLAD